MAFISFALKKFKLHQPPSQLRSLLPTLVSHPSFRPQNHTSVNGCFHFFSQTFRRTPSTPSHALLQSLFFSTFQPSSLQPHYNPIEFNDFETKINQNDDLAVSKLVKLVRETKEYTSKKEAIDFVADSGMHFDANQLHLAIWQLRNDWELALIAYKLSEKWGCITEKLLGLIVWVLGTHQKFDIAWSLIRDLHRLVDTRRAMLAIIERYAAANNHEKAIKTFHFMEKLTIHPDQNAFYTVMSALCRYGNIEEAEEFMLINKKLFPLETEGFNIILHGWCDISIDVVEAKRIWREMATQCVTPNALSYTHMISCFSRVGNLFDSVRLYDEMKKRGWSPGLDVYNSLMYVMANENCLSEALKILEKIKEAGLKPDTRSYNCLICPLCDAGRFEEARNLLSIMAQDSAQPTIETYQAFLKGANLEGTFKILSQMKNDKVGPDNCTFLLIFERFFKLQEPENVLKVWVEMIDFGVHPELTHYKTLISGLANCGCLLKAKELHIEMLSNGFLDDPKLQVLLQGQGQGQEQGRSHGKVGSVKSVRSVRVSKSSYKVRNSPSWGRKKQGSRRS